MQDKQPWIVAKSLEENPDNQKLIDNCLHLCLQLTANMAILANPFMPFTAKKMLYMMKVVDKILDWENTGRIDLLKVNYPLRAPELLFKKIDDEQMKEQVDKLHNAGNAAKAAAAEAEQEAPTHNPVKPEIVYDDFAKIDLRVGTIIAAEKVEKADKLLKLELDMGFEKRTVVSGIAMHYKPEEIVGKQVTVVTNLAPRKMRGIESAGMILMAEDKDGKLVFVSPVDTTAPGSEVR
jgi:methionyl-tRNA synthetase